MLDPVKINWPESPLLEAGLLELPENSPTLHPFVRSRLITNIQQKSTGKSAVHDWFT